MRKAKFTFHFAVVAAIYKALFLFFNLFSKLSLPSLPSLEAKLHTSGPTQTILPPLLTKPKHLHWKKIVEEKGIEPVAHRIAPPTISCPDCEAPAEFIYNNGISFLCKLCGRQVKKVKKRQANKYPSLFCPYCSRRLDWKKERSCFIVYKCINKDCPFRAKANQRYTWRLLLPQASPKQSLAQKTLPSRPFISLFAYILFFSFHCGLPASIVSLVLSTIFSITLSPQTILNWEISLASKLYTRFFSTPTAIPNILVLDEVFFKIRKKKYYLFFALNPCSREVIAFYLSDRRDANSAFPGPGSFGQSPETDLP